MNSLHSRRRDVLSLRRNYVGKLMNTSEKFKVKAVFFVKITAI